MSLRNIGMYDTELYPLIVRFIIKYHMIICDFCGKINHIIKTKRRHEGSGNTRNVYAEVIQGINLEWDFMMKMSYDTSRIDRIYGIIGEQACLMISYHFIGNIYNVFYVRNKPPLRKINHWILCNTPSTVKKNML